MQKAVPNAKVVKAFNIVGNPLMFRPELPGGPPDMFIAGNDEEAKKTVGGILKDFGWGAVYDLGGIESSRYLEAMCMAWVLSAARVVTLKPWLSPPFVRVPRVRVATTWVVKSLAERTCTRT